MVVRGAISNMCVKAILCVLAEEIVFPLLALLSDSEHLKNLNNSIQRAVLSLKARRSR